MSMKNRITVKYFMKVQYTEKDVEKTCVLDLLSVAISKKGYVPDEKESIVDDIPRVELKNTYQLSTILNELIRDVGINMSKTSHIPLHMGNDGSISLGRGDGYDQISLIHLETDLDLSELDEFLSNSRESILETIAINIPAIKSDNSAIYTDDTKDYIISLCRDPKDLGIEFGKCVFL